MTKRFDVAVVGAGLSGKLLALALDQAGFSVALIDRAAPGTPVDDGRTTALAYASVRLFKRLGLWDTLGPKTEPITDILVSNGEPKDRFRPGGLTGGQLHFPSALLGMTNGEPDEPALGYIAENKDMLEAFDKAAATSSITELFGAAVEDYDAPQDQGHGTLRLADGTEIETQLVVACDGRRSPLRERMKLSTLSWEYPQTAIIFNIAHEKPHHGVAHEVFYPDGPFAILPMPNNCSSIVWTERKGAARSYLALDDQAFLVAARERIGDHLGDIKLASPRQSYPLSLVYAPKLISERFAVAGDAAHGIHPIAGQGFNLGIKDIGVMVDVLSDAQSAGLDIGHGAVLANYDRWRRFDSASLSLGTDVLNRLFSNNFGPLKHARGLGLGLVQRIDPLRKTFMRLSGADLGDLPTLMQPL